MNEESNAVCCQCHTAYNIIPDPPIFDGEDKRVHFCERCWEAFLAESVVVGAKEYS